MNSTVRDVIAIRFIAVVVVAFATQTGFCQQQPTVGETASRSSAQPDAEQTPSRSPVAAGPLRVQRDNPRYFTDDSGKAVYLAGWNIWSNNQDGFGTGWEHGWGDSFDFNAYLDDLVVNNLNYIRLWLYETAKVEFPGGVGVYRGSTPDIPVPNPWQRTGPDVAADGGLKFDLTKYNQEYFDRVRSRVAAAGKRGIYVSVMLFEGFSIRSGTNEGHRSLPFHPFHAANNINGINGDPNEDGDGPELHSLSDPAITKLQEAYVRKVIDTLNDLDNVIYEIANESYGTAEWQYHMIRFVRAYEAQQPKQHPVLMSAAGAITNEHLEASPADAIAPARKGSREDYIVNPPATDGKHVVIADTDHMGWNRFRNDKAKGRTWAWKNFTRGYNASLLIVIPDKAGWNEARRALGDTRSLATRINLVAMTPRNDLASSEYCLADAGKAYLVYLPSGGNASVDLSAALGELAVEWLNPSTGKSQKAKAVYGGVRRGFKAPFGGDAVLYIHANRDD
jgi:hypothetical protein